MSLSSCAHPGAPIEDERILKASAPARPGWIEEARRSDDRTLRWSGRGAGSTVKGAIRAARRDAVAEAVRFYYGPVIDRFFGVETDESSVFMEDRDSNTSKETQNRAIERILEAPIESPERANVQEQYWELHQLPTDDGAGRELVQAYALVTVQRRSADAIVAHLLGESPTQIAIAGLLREAAFLVTEAKKQSKDGLAAGRANRVPEMIVAQRRTEELLRDLERAKARHETIAGGPIPVDIVAARRAVADLDRLCADVLASLKIGVNIDVYSGAQARIPGLTRWFTETLSSLSVATASAGERRCGPGHSHWLQATFLPPECVRPEEGSVCDLGLQLEIGRCPSQQPADTYIVDSSALRGRGASDRRAVLQAWSDIEGPNRAALVREVMVLLARHIPVRRETPVRP